MKRNNKKGFTIVELVIVIAVIAILAGVLIPTFSGVVKKAKENAALQEIKNAYTNAYALALSNDGVITENDDITDELTADKVEASGKVTGYTLKDDKYTFTFDANGKLTAAVETDSPAAFTYDVDDGVITGATKAN